MIKGGAEFEEEKNERSSAYGDGKVGLKQTCSRSVSFPLESPNLEELLEGKRVSKAMGKSGYVSPP